MKVILLTDVAKVGKKYEVKNVADGFGRNFLIGRGAALLADAANLAKLRVWQSGQAAELAMEHDLAVKALAALKDQVVTIRAKANAEGHLFAGLRATDLAAKVAGQSGINLNPAWLVLDKPLKLLGPQTVELKIGELAGRLNLMIVKE